MLSKYAEANAFDTSGAHNQFPKWGQRRPIMRSASIESIGLRISCKHWPLTLLKALAIHALYKPHVLKAALGEEGELDILLRTFLFMLEGAPCPGRCERPYNTSCRNGGQVRQASR